MKRNEVLRELMAMARGATFGQTRWDIRLKYDGANVEDFEKWQITGKNQDQ